MILTGATGGVIIAMAACAVRSGPAHPVAAVASNFIKWSKASTRVPESSFCIGTFIVTSERSKTETSDTSECMRGLLDTRGFSRAAPFMKFPSPRPPLDRTIKWPRNRPK